ncbi:AraC family transcriptional regulator [Mucilaginibacter yixingensis]|uniref:AraC family transcriptional regulator n=1 Tax=Mucilaginibacter yixingensis TaxID=1295612 RepID=A0A2T5JGE7_9SPHI|nr:helix-turn-helix domain-containing protein [Mucilaginibacter yixingensis]PTR01507.1 AraC family transcriptional regulator [Mucilaginibacter yixingensis]
MSQKRTTTIGKFEGLYGDRQARSDRDYLFAERLETRSKQFGWQIEPHTHPGIMQIFLVTTGEVELQEAGEVSRLAAPCLLVIPATHLHGFKFSEQSGGYIVSLSDILFASLWKDVPVLTAMAGQLIRITEFSATYSSDRISSMMEAITIEQEIHDARQQLMLTACLQQLFLAIYRLIPPVKTESTALGTGHMIRLQQLIRESEGQISVEQLAGALHLSAPHLNRLCRKATGRSVSGLINDYLVTEARKYLSYTNLTIAQIAYRLHFEYPNYFARFFKQHTGQTPGDYRKK